MSWREVHSHGMDILGSSRTTLGPRGRNVVFGAQRDGKIEPWDNADSYLKDDVVYHDMRYYRALRDISAPLLPAIFTGEVPGQSDAWREISKAQAYAKPATVLGMVDMNVVQRNLNDLKPVTVEIARILLDTGQNVIAQAISGAKQPWYKADLPGGTARKNVQAHLAWHANNIASIHGVNEQTTAYAAGDDLKKYVGEAFVEANAVEEGAQWLADAWNKMWGEIQTRLAAIPRVVGQTAAEVVKTAAGAAAGGIAAGFGVPTWLVWSGIGIGVLTLGYIAVKKKVWRYI